MVYQLVRGVFIPVRLLVDSSEDRINLNRYGLEALESVAIAFQAIVFSQGALQVQLGASAAIKSAEPCVGKFEVRLRPLFKWRELIELRRIL